MLADLIRKSLTGTAPLRTRASSQPYDAGATGRRAQAWNVTRLGPSTLLWGNLDQLRARSHDQVRNNAWAGSAVDKFESNTVGSGIQPHWQHPNPKIVTQLQTAWRRWSEEADWNGQCDWHGLQALMAREVFEGGEVFIRYRLRPSKDKLFIPLQLQLIEGEQLPVYRNVLMHGGLAVGGRNHMVRNGIEFDDDGRRVAYHFYKEHPGETMFYPLDALQFIEIPAEDVSHVYKMLRAGQLRGEPGMTRVLTLLYELDQYTDAELLRKKVAAMFAGFITKPVPQDQILPPAPFIPNPPNIENPLNPSVPVQQDIGTTISKLEPGTFQDLYPGEEITFPDVPDSPDFSGFLNVQLHKFAAGCNMTYEQLTGDLKGVTYSSIRAGLLEFRRACEQIQFNVFVHLGCRPTMKRWLKEGVLVGALNLPGYFDNPSQYENVIWVPPGWEWVDPQKEVAAQLQAVRSGFTSRTIVVRESGRDPEEIDAQQADERARAAKLGITYDSDPNKVLIGRETQPDVPGTAKPTRETEIETEDVQAATFTAPPRRHKKTNGRVVQ